MKGPEDRSLVEILRDSSDHELLVVSVIVSPFVLSAWAWVLNATIPSGTWYWYILRFVILFLVIPLLYCQGMLTLRNRETEPGRLQRQRKILATRLKYRKNRTASIQRLASMDSDSPRELTEDRIHELLKTFPGFFASCSIKGTNPDEPGRPGVKLTDDE